MDHENRCAPPTLDDRRNSMDVDKNDTGTELGEPMDLDTADAKGKLPFPGGLGPDGAMQARYIAISGVNRLTLIDLCRGYGLGVAGNMGVLRQKLEDFSGDRSRWNSFVPSKRRMHRNPQSAGVAKASSKSKKLSSQRADMVFPGRVVQPTPHLIRPLPEEAPPPQSLQRRSEILKWASGVQARLAHLVTEEEMESAASTYLARMRGNTIAPAATIPPDDSNRLQEIATSISLLSTLSNLALTTPQVLWPSLLYQQDQSLPDPSHTTPSDTTGGSSGLSAVQKDVPTRTLMFRDGTSVTFAESDVVAPPSISFANNLQKLNSMWDKNNPQYRSPLVIHGMAIPVVYWREVYASRSKSRVKGQPSLLWKPGQWKGIKNSWSEWKSIVAQFRQGSEDDFWRRFSDSSGVHLGYTAIVGRINEIKLAEDTILVQKAQAEYCDTFDTIFSYKKSGKTCLLKKASAIARKYRELKGLIDEHDEDDQWE
ncbi:hypothetical protein CPB83DRAFT_808968 [Crepidotus variabilis]|uniref:Uncharacterized protein n=1 Tax=Crepidotus variabilis TaxID=179855 RepID=A0A9P6EM15_9AGAR|nr:hypothetical protein CPB83DRAFT_808968 [Crepidotus variabilis]